jgi:hypothetical protein
MGQSPVFTCAKRNLLDVVPFSFGGSEIYDDLEESSFADIPHGDLCGDTIVHFAIDIPGFTIIKNVAVQLSFCSVAGMFRNTNAPTVRVTTAQNDRADDYEGHYPSGSVRRRRGSSSIKTRIGNFRQASVSPG